MSNSIPTEAWQVNADDPLALTHVLGLPEFRVTRLEYDDHLEHILVFCAAVDALAICPSCGTSSFQVHESTERVVRDLAWAGKACYLVITARRFKCWRCRKSFRYEHYLFAQCRGTTIQAVHRQERLGYKAVEGVYYRLAARAQVEASPPEVHRLGIDEIAVKKGHGQYALVLTDLDCGRVITVLADRSKESLEAYLATWSVEARAAVSDVALDLWEPYHGAVRAQLPTAQISGDRFHVMKNLTERVAEARREIQREAGKEVKDTLKGCRWLLVKNAVDLTAEEQAKLAAMFVVSPTLQRLHELKEAFRTIFETAAEPVSAAEQLAGWIAEVEQSGLRQVRKFVTTLRRWWDVIVYYFHERLTSGFVEGMNNKIKLIKRRGFGYRNFDHFCLRVLCECDGECDAH